MAAPAPLLTLTEAAEWLRISPRRLRTLAETAQVPAVRIPGFPGGHNWRFDPATIRERLTATPGRPSRTTNRSNQRPPGPVSCVSRVAGGKWIS